MRKRFKQLAKWFGYLAVGTAIILTTVLLVAYGQGYFYSPETGRVGGGLFFVDSEPSGARITVDGTYRGTTDRRVRMPVGEYLVEIDREGYRPWSKHLAIEQAKVTHVQYPILLPNNVSTATAASFGTVERIVQSPNRRYLAIVENDSRIQLSIFDLNNDTDSLMFNAPRTLVGFSVDSVVWSPDNARLLLTLTSDDITRQFLINRQNPNGTVDFTEATDMIVAQPVFHEGGDSLYGLVDGTLRSFDLDDNTSSILAGGITSFTLHQDEVYAISNQADGHKLLTVSTQPSAELMALKGDHRIFTAEFDNQLFLVLQSRSRRQIALVAGLGTGALTTTTLPVGTARELTISPNNRFVTAHNGRHFMTYDLEQQKLYRFQLPALPGELNWYGNYHLLSVVDGDVLLFEFDGGNIETLTRSDSWPVFGSRRGNAIYSLSMNELTNSLELQKSLIK